MFCPRTFCRYIRIVGISDVGMSGGNCSKSCIAVSEPSITCWNSTQNHSQSAYGIDIYQATLVTPSTVVVHPLVQSCLVCHWCRAWKQKALMRPCLLTSTELSRTFFFFIVCLLFLFLLSICICQTVLAALWRQQGRTPVHFGKSFSPNGATRINVSSYSVRRVRASLLQHLTDFFWQKGDKMVVAKPRYQYTMWTILVLIGMGRGDSFSVGGLANKLILITTFARCLLSLFLILILYTLLHRSRLSTWRGR